MTENSKSTELMWLPLYDVFRNFKKELILILNKEKIDFLMLIQKAEELI